MEYLIIDPWWFTADKQGSNNPEDVILWACGTGFVVRSDDAGKNWIDVTPNIGNPPNLWDDSPAPTVADITFTVIQGNNYFIDNFHIIATWQPTGSDERTWIARTSDNGASWIWFDIVGCSSDFSIFLGSAPNANTVGDTFVFTAALSSGSYRIQFAIEALEGCPCQNYDITISSVNGGTFYPSGGPALGNITNCALSDVWRYSDQGYGSGGGNLINTWEAFSGLLGSSTPWSIDMSAVPSDAPPDARFIFFDIDNQDGTEMWVTMWQNGNLFVQKRSTSLVILSQISLGAATIAQLDDRDYIAFPFMPGNDKDIWFVFGRMNNPQSLGNPTHIILTQDGGDTWSDVGDSGTWGADYIGAFFATDTSNLFAFLNGSSRGLYRSVDGGSTWVLLSSTPFDVDPGGISLFSDGRLLITNRFAGVQMAAYAEGPDYTSWFDATGNPPFIQTGGGSHSVSWIT
jgi:hypothetical protein